MELEDQDLSSEMLKQQKRAVDFWQKHWVQLCAFLSTLLNPNTSNTSLMGNCPAQSNPSKAKASCTWPWEISLGIEYCSVSIFQLKNENGSLLARCKRSSALCWYLFYSCVFIFSPIYPLSLKSAPLSVNTYSFLFCIAGYCYACLFIVTLF